MSIQACEPKHTQIQCIFFVLKTSEPKHTLNTMSIQATSVRTQTDANTMYIRRLKASEPKHTLNTMSFFVLKASESKHTLTDNVLHTMKIEACEPKQSQIHVQCIFFVLKACEPKHTLNAMYQSYHWYHWTSRMNHYSASSPQIYSKSL